MTRSRYRIYDTHYPHFLTCTINGWLPIFTRQEAADIIFDSWRYLQKERDLKIFAYVILENHLHLVASAPELPDIVHRFKSWTARQLIELLNQRHSSTLLNQLHAIKLNHKKDSAYQVWQEGSHPQQIVSEDMMRQKVEYIHNNPVVRGFVDDPEHWRWSSARVYAGKKGPIEIEREW